MLKVYFVRNVLESFSLIVFIVVYSVLIAGQSIYITPIYIVGGVCSIISFCFVPQDYQIRIGQMRSTGGQDHYGIKAVLNPKPKR